MCCRQLSLTCSLATADGRNYQSLGVSISCNSVFSCFEVVTISLVVVIWVNEWGSQTWLFIRPKHTQALVRRWVASSSLQPTISDSAACRLTSFLVARLRWDIITHCQTTSVFARLDPFPYRSHSFRRIVAEGRSHLSANFGFPPFAVTLLPLFFGFSGLSPSVLVFVATMWASLNPGACSFYLLYVCIIIMRLCSSSVSHPLVNTINFYFLQFWSMLFLHILLCHLYIFCSVYLFPFPCHFTS